MGMTRNKKFHILNLILWLPISAMAVSPVTSSVQEITSFTIDKSKNDLTTYFKSQYLNQDSEVNKANQFRVQLGLELDKRITDQLSFKLNTSLSLETGNSDSLYDNNEFKPDNSISLKRAEFIWSPLAQVKITAGALAMKDSNHGLLVGHGTFMGAKESYSFTSDNLEGSISALQSIPKNTNYSNRLDEVNEENPSFFLESLNLKYGSAKNNIKSTTSHFAYANLSNSVAATSYYLGNSVNLSDRTNGEFLFSYIGYAQKLEAQFEVSSFSINPYGEYIQNTAAPSNNEGRVLGLEVVYSQNDQEYTIDFCGFDSDSDSSVAFYNSSLYRNNNKRGNILKLQYEDLRSQLLFEMILINSRLKNSIQLDDKNNEEQIIGLTLRKEYDIF
jgi:hypothetical protein